ncbi:cytadherence protein C [Mycoplasma bradburyae]|uniref:cytadherence protein C n=1 Tax=Mycoplasma bradburyae TaxID=2963128 RepID=UPI0020CC0469|nr:cytadherence protein C [Mycoplasma bradburyae]UTS71015.1 cytadherence protein C [Mycoplasma bradburyae]
MKQLSKRFTKLNKSNLIKILVSIFFVIFISLGLTKIFISNNQNNNQIQATNLNNKTALVEQNNSYDDLKTTNNTYVQNSKNDYFALTQTGVKKLDVFGNVYYSYNYGKDFINYQTVDFVANNLKSDYYYLLIKNPIVNITGNNLSTISISSPAYVLELKDENNSLKIIKKFQLNPYRFSRDLASLFIKVGFEPKLSKNPTNDEIINNKNYALGLLDRPTNSSILNNISYYYYNSISRLAFINNRLAVFGSNDIVSLWFYLFDVNKTDDNVLDNNKNLINIYPRLFATTNLNWSLGNYNNSEHTKTTQFVVNNIKLYTPAYFITGINVIKQKLIDQNNPENQNQTSIYSLHLGLIPAPIIKINETNHKFSHIISSTYYSSTNTNYSNIFISGAISQSKVVEITNNFSTVNEFFSASYSIKLYTNVLNKPDQANTLSQYAYHYSVQEDQSDNKINGYPNLIGILILRSQIIGFIFSGDTYTLHTDSIYNLLDDETSMSGFDYITNIILYKAIWWISFYNPTTSTTWVNQINTNISITNDEVLLINYSEIYRTTKSGLAFLIFVLNDNAFYLFRDLDNLIESDLIYLDQANQKYIKADFFNNGVPVFDNKPDSKGSSLWGTVNFKPASYLVEQKLNTMNAYDIVNNDFIINKLYDYQPGKINWAPRVVTNVINDNKFVISFEFPYFDGNYYKTDQILKNLEFPSFEYNNLKASPVYLVPTIVLSIIVSVILLLAFIFLIIMQILKTKKVSLQLFTNANNKIDKLNDSVNIIYQKIETKLYNPQTDRNRLTGKFNKPNDHLNIGNNQTRMINNNQRIINQPFQRPNNYNHFNNPQFFNQRQNPTRGYYPPNNQQAFNQASRMNHTTAHGFRNNPPRSNQGFNNQTRQVNNTSFYQADKTRKIN